MLLQPLSGWGRTAPTTALVGRPLDVSSVLRLVAGPSRAVSFARGLGRSYGDAAQCTGGLTIDTAGLRHVGALDEAAGTIEVGGGVSLHDLMRRLIPAGWFVPVTPGTRYVTVGGAIAADVHGKNHHRDGSFARHVVEMSLVTPSGMITVSPDREPDLFWATAGGMGLTGVVVSAVLRLIPIETSWMQVDSQRFSRLDDADVDDGEHGLSATATVSRGWTALRGTQRRSSLSSHAGGPRSFRCPPGSAAEPQSGGPW